MANYPPANKILKKINRLYRETLGVDGSPIKKICLSNSDYRVLLEHFLSSFKKEYAQCYSRCESDEYCIVKSFSVVGTQTRVAIIIDNNLESIRKFTWNGLPVLNETKCEAKKKPETLTETITFFDALVYPTLKKETTDRECIINNSGSPKTFEQLKAAGEPCIKIADLCIWGETE